MVPRASGLGRGAVIAFALQVGGVALTYLLHVALARWLGASGYGAYAYVLSWVTLLATAAALGLPLASLRFLSRHRDAEDWDGLRGVLRGMPALALAFALAVVATAAVGAPGPVSLGDWRWGLLLVPGLALTALYTEMGRALGSVTLSLAPTRVLRPLLTLLLVLAAFSLAEPSPRGALQATAAALALVLAVQWMWTRRAVPGPARGGPARYPVGRWLRTAVPLVVGVGASLLLTQLDLLMVGWLAGERPAGLYSAAAKSAALVSFVLYAANVAAAPRIAALHARGETRALQELAHQVVRWAFWPSLLLTAALMVAAPWILAVFGPEFAAAGRETAVLALGYLFSAGVGSVGYLLNLTGHERHNARTLLWAVVLDAGLNAVAIPALGGLGAALSTTATWVFVGLRLHRLTRRHVGVRASILSARRSRTP